MIYPRKKGGIKGVRKVKTGGFAWDAFVKPPETVAQIVSDGQSGRIF